MKKSSKIFSSIAGITLVILVIWVAVNKFVPTQRIDVYFVRTANDEIIFETVKRPVMKTQNPLEIAISELLKGPSKKEQKQGLYSEIPKATKLLGIKESDKKFIINLSRDFEYGGGSSSLMTRTDQLIKTSLQSAGEKEVYLELDGELADVIGGEGIILEQPLKETLSK